jgi:hypothetical protein
LSSLTESNRSAGRHAKPYFPNLSTSSLGIFPKIFIPVLEMAIDSSLRRMK